MLLPEPTTLRHVLIDGTIPQVATDEALIKDFGHPYEYAFNRTPQGYQVRWNTPKGVYILDAVVAAHIDPDDQWYWHQQFAFAIPELAEGPHHSSEELLTAARTLNGNGPAYLVPTEDGHTDVIVATPSFPQLPLAHALTLGLGQARNNNLTDDEIRRAIIAFAAQNDYSVAEDGLILCVRSDNGEQAHVDIARLKVRDLQSTTPQLRLTDVLADATFVAAEHQLLLNGRFPDARATTNDDCSVVTLTTPTGQTLRARALLIATLRGETLQWSWADPAVCDLPGAKAALEVKNFAIDNGLGMLLGQVDAATALSQRLYDAAKPVSRFWTDVRVPLSDGSTAIMLIDASELRLPPPSHAAVFATLHETVPHGRDIRRALSYYGAFRRITIEDVDYRRVRVHAPSAPIQVSMDACGRVCSIV